MQRSLSRAFFGFLDRLFLVLSFGEIAESGLPAVEGPISDKYAALMRGLLADPDYARLAGDPRRPVAADRAIRRGNAASEDLGAADRAIRRGNAASEDLGAAALTRRALGGARGAVESACFVYAHTLLNALAGELLALVRAEGKPPAQRLGAPARRLDAPARAAEARLALAAKACRLSRLCGAGGSKALCGRLARLDRLREEVVAGRASGPFREENRAVLAAGLELAGLAAAKLGVRLDPAELLAP